MRQALVSLPLLVRTLSAELLLPWLGLRVLRLHVLRLLRHVSARVKQLHRLQSTRLALCARQGGRCAQANERTT